MCQPWPYFSFILSLRKSASARSYSLLSMFSVNVSLWVLLGWHWNAPSGFFSPLPPGPNPYYSVRVFFWLSTKVPSHSATSAFVANSGGVFGQLVLIIHQAHGIWWIVAAARRLYLLLAGTCALSATGGLYLLLHPVNNCATPHLFIKHALSFLGLWLHVTAASCISSLPVCAAISLNAAMEEAVCWYFTHNLSKNWLLAQAFINSPVLFQFNSKFEAACSQVLSCCFLWPKISSWIPWVICCHVKK